MAAGKTASAVSSNRVEGRTVANAAPSFAGQDQLEGTAEYVDITRTVTENTAVGSNIGKPVSASDADGDILIYSLVDTPDLKAGADNSQARFTIDPASGQIKVGKKLGADAGQEEDEASDSVTPPPPELGVTPNVVPPATADNNHYVLQVKATDPSTASTTVNVIVIITNSNEGPEFLENAPATVLVTELEADNPLRTPGTPAVALATGAYVATDEDDGDTVPDVGGYALEGADKDSFSINNDGELSVAEDHEPNYEKQSSYSITIVARSGADTRRADQPDGCDGQRGGCGRSRYGDDVAEGAAGWPDGDSHAR